MGIFGSFQQGQQGHQRSEEGSRPGTSQPAEGRGSAEASAEERRQAMTYYKAVRPNGRDFYSNSITWLPENPVFPYTVEHPDPSDGYGAARYFSVSVAETGCTGSQWPLRLLEVEAVEGHAVFTPHADDLPSKRAATAFRVVRELPAHLAFGPQGEQLAALIERARPLTADEVDRLAAARDAARDAAWDAARDAAWAAAWAAARAAAWDAAWAAVRDAALGLLVRDLIPLEHYDKLTGPWRRTIGRIHPGDPELS